MMEAGVTQENKNGGKKKDGNYGSGNDTKFNSHPVSSFPKSRKVIKRDRGNRKAPPPPEKMDGGKNGEKKDGNDSDSRSDTKLNLHPGSSFPKSRKVIGRKEGESLVSEVKMESSFILNFEK